MIASLKVFLDACEGDDAEEEKWLWENLLVMYELNCPLLHQSSWVTSSIYLFFELHHASVLWAICAYCISRFLFQVSDDTRVGIMQNFALVF